MAGQDIGEWTQVKRDAFARETLERRREYGGHQGMSCAWCGSARRTSQKPSGRWFVFRYRVVSDGGRTSEDAKLFCSTDCRESYNS